MTKNRTKINKGKDSGGDTIPGHLTQAWHKPRGVPIPWTQVSFGDEGGGGDDEVVVSLSPFSILRRRVKLSILNSSFSISSFNILLHNASLLSFRKRGGIG